MRSSIQQRFEEKFLKTPSGCWEWQASKRKGGYGRFSIGTRNYCAHRVSYQLYRGCEPGNFQVCHKCDNPKCVNPDHLFLGTNQDNVDDKVAKGRQGRAGPTVAANGESHGRAKLTEVDIVEIRRLIATKHSTQYQIGKRFGVSQAVISSINRRKTWNHL